MIRWFNAGIFASLILLWACDSESEGIDCNSTDLAINIVSSNNPGCNLSDGAITVAGTGGSGIYVYSMDGVNFDNQPNFNNLAAGVYTLSVRDEHQCMATVETTLNNESDLAITVDVGDAGCNTTNGSIMISATGGVAPYTYRLNSGDLQSEHEFTGLAPGAYAITIVDENGCEANENVNVVSGLSLATNIKLIIDSNCAVSGCHIGNGLPDFRNSATIIANAANIRSHTTAKTMPPPSSGIQLTDDQISQIACWVNDGAPNN